ncbi:MAG: hypothetical protein ABJE95_17920 [Byssovorax sp.]
MNDKLRSDSRLHLYRSGELVNNSPREANPSGHTMGQDNFRRYIDRHGLTNLELHPKKLSTEQAQMLARAYTDGLTIRVISAYRDDLEHLLQKNNAALIKGPIAHRKAKNFNGLRQIAAMVRRNGTGDTTELWFLVFPSRQYVEQTAELIAAIVADFKAKRPVDADTARVLVTHFEDLESTIPHWTGFSDFISIHVRHGDVVAIGNIELILKGLNEFGFEALDNQYIFGGLNEMFGIRVVVNKHNFARLVLIGVTESFWGDASAQYVQAILDAGATHILYGSKAASMVAPEDVHSIYAPERFSLVNQDGRTSAVGYQRGTVGDFIEKLGVFTTGVSVTVPTVIGESHAQHESLKKIGPTCMDCEDGHIAETLSKHNDYMTHNQSKLSSDDFRAQFVPIHFITDYIYSGGESVDTSAGHLSVHATGETAASALYQGKRDRAFERIGNVFGTYALSFGIKDVGARVDEISPVVHPNEHNFERVFETVKPLLNAGLGREALAELSAGRDGDSYRVVPAMVHAIVCQKHGYISAALSSLTKLSRPEVLRGLSDIVRTQIAVIYLKVCSQVGSVHRLHKHLNALQENPSQELIVRNGQFGAVMRREAIFHALSQMPDKAQEAISLAADLNKTDIHYQQTNVLFGEIAALPRSGEKDLAQVSETLSRVRSSYLGSLSSGRWLQTNFEKCTLAALFLEASYYLCSGVPILIERGARTLTVAHLLNLRLGGNELSETYGEIVACTPDRRVKNVVALAMREDMTAQATFQRWVHSRFANLPRVAQSCMGVLQLALGEREEALSKILRAAT